MLFYNIVTKKKVDRYVKLLRKEQYSEYSFSLAAKSCMDHIKIATTIVFNKYTHISNLYLLRIDNALKKLKKIQSFHLIKPKHVYKNKGIRSYQMENIPSYTTYRFLS